MKTTQPNENNLYRFIIQIENGISTFHAARSAHIGYWLDTDMQTILCNYTAPYKIATKSYWLVRAEEIAIFKLIIRLNNENRCRLGNIWCMALNEHHIHQLDVFPILPYSTVRLTSP